MLPSHPKASPPRMWRASIRSGSAWTVGSRLSSKLYAVSLLACNGYVHTTASSSRIHHSYGHGALMADGWPHGRNASLPRRAHRVRGELASAQGRPGPLAIASGASCTRFARMQSVCPYNRIPIKDTRLQWLMTDGCPRGRNARQSEPTAYEAS